MNARAMVAAVAATCAVALLAPAEAEQRKIVDGVAINIGVVPAARFAPEDLTITSRGRLFRPVGIVPMSPSWSNNQLEAREQAAALYLYEEGIGLDEPFTVTYLGVANESWARSIPLLQREAARVASRIGTSPATTPADTIKP